MHKELAGRLGLGPIDQVAYAVTSLDRALKRYEAIFGPFEVMDTLMEGCMVRGRRVDIRLLWAINRSGPVEVELIQPVEGEYAVTEHLRTHGEGLHHVRFRLPPPLEPKLEQLRGEGFETLLYKRFEQPPAAFAYLQTPAELGGSVIELLETF
jgi:catechol 2,3-dioxygenase-like lactoylglutathione lyase family enzyme